MMHVSKILFWVIFGRFKITHKNHLNNINSCVIVSKNESELFFVILSNDSLIQYYSNGTK